MYYAKQNSYQTPPNKTVWCLNKIETNQIILEKKSNVKTESTQHATEIWRVLHLEYATVEAN